jgi:Tfp pilus assembly protein PilX
MSFQRPKGQTLLIVVLVLTIAITVALSLIGRTTTDVKMTQQLEESARAFNAAEAGIEDALTRASGITATIQSGTGEAFFTTTIQTIGGSFSVYTYPSLTKKGDVATIWLVAHNEDGTLDQTNHYCQTGGACLIDICWETTSPQTAAEIAILYKNTGTNLYNMERFAYDPDSTRTGNKFTTTDIATSGCGKASGVAKVRITLPTTNALPIMLRLRPYYSDTTFSVEGVDSRAIPSQGFEISSVGQTGSGISRKIVVKRQFDAPPSIFDYVVYSEGDITHE